MKQYKIIKPIRLIELFAGIGSQAKALKKIGVDFEHYKVCEFDKYAIAYIGDGIYTNRCQSKRGVVQRGMIPTLKTSCNDVAVVGKDMNELISIRRLTPRECWRLMGFDDEDFEKAKKVNSNTQLYKQAGNSIVVNVLEQIFKQFF